VIIYELLTLSYNTISPGYDSEIDINFVSFNVFANINNPPSKYTHTPTITPILFIIEH
jgi:hypothetical protein